jgi:hypothetical protein
MKVMLGDSGRIRAPATSDISEIGAGAHRAKEDGSIFDIITSYGAASSPAASNIATGAFGADLLGVAIKAAVDFVDAFSLESQTRGGAWEKLLRIGILKRLEVAKIQDRPKNEADPCRDEGDEEAEEEGRKSVHGFIGESWREGE